MEDHHLAADVVRRLAHPASLHAGESGGPALALEAPCGEPIEANQVAFDGSLARHRDRLAQALELKAEHGDEARFLAGGQSLVPTMNFRLTQPAMLIDINPVAPLRYVRNDAGFVEIGAMTR